MGSRELVGRIVRGDLVHIVQPHWTGELRTPEVLIIFATNGRTTQALQVGVSTSPGRSRKSGGVAVEPGGRLEVVRSGLAGHRELRVTFCGAFFRDRDESLCELCDHVGGDGLLTVRFRNVMLITLSVRDLRESTRGTVLTIVCQRRKGRSLGQRRDFLTA